MVNQPFCPFCKSRNVTPGAKVWHCGDCGRDFEQVFVEEAPDPTQAKEGEKPSGNDK